MKILFRIALAAWVAAGIDSSAFAKDASANAPDAAIQRLLREASIAVLKEGNARFVSGKAQHPNLDAERRTGTAVNGQEPVVTILTCSDSRAPVELIFDRGIGDIFVVRVAGNIAGESELATVEYGVDHLGTPVLLVMGHTKCGAVTAVVKGAELHGHLHSLADHIKPAAEKAKQAGGSVEATIVAAIEANVWLTIENILKKSEAIRERAKTGKVQIIGAVYDIESGKVNFLGSHTAQNDILSGNFTEDHGTDHPTASHETAAPAATKPSPAPAVESAANAELAPFPKLPAPESLDRNQPGRVNSLSASKAPLKKSNSH